MASNKHIKQTPEERAEFLRARRRGFSGPLMFVVVIVAVIFVLSVFLRVSDVQVEGNVHYTDEEIIRAFEIEEGDNLFFFDRIAAAARAYSKLPYIKEVAIERKLPNKVLITVEESTALAYLELGDEQWTMDDTCKILGKATQSELSQLVPIVGIDPGTLLIGETLTTSDANTATVKFLADVLWQLEKRGLAPQTTQVDFSDPDSPAFSYGGRFTVVLGRNNALEHKFGMFVSVLEQLKAGDVGVIDVSDGTTAHFRPD